MQGCGTAVCTTCTVRTCTSTLTRARTYAHTSYPRAHLHAYTHTSRHCTDTCGLGPTIYPHPIFVGGVPSGCAQGRVGGRHLWARAGHRCGRVRYSLGGVWYVSFAQRVAVPTHPRTLTLTRIPTHADGDFVHRATLPGISSKVTDIAFAPAHKGLVLVCMPMSDCD